MAISDKDLATSKGLSEEQVRLLRATRGASNDTLYLLDPTALRRALRRLDYPDMPKARYEFRAGQQRDDLGRIDHAALGKALRALRTMRKKKAAKAHVAGLPTGGLIASPLALVAAKPVPVAPAPAAPAGPAPVGGLARAAWKWVGPGNIGGRTRAILVHPTQPLRMWAGSAGGGVWKTIDGGAKWEPVDDFMANLAVSCLAMDPTRPDVMYAGTGEGFSNADALRGAGVFRTVNGVAWAQLSATATADFQFVDRIAVSSNGRVLLVATGTGLFRSSDVARAVWRKVIDAPMGDVRFAHGSSLKAVAGALESGRAFVSADGGRTWSASTHAGAWSGRVELAYAAKDARIVYASVQQATGEIWRSSNGGKSFVKRASNDPSGSAAEYLGDQGWYGNAIWAGDPRNADLVVVGGINLWRSTDGGNTLREISTWFAPRSVHADHHAIVSHPGYDGLANRTVFFGNDGGIFKAIDLAAVGIEAQPPFVSGWSELVNSYGVTQFYSGAGNAASGKVVGGAQDNGTVCFDPAKGTEQWTTIFGGDGGFCAADPTDPKVFYGEYVYLDVHRNTDGGTTDDLNGDRYISGHYWDGHAWSWKQPPFLIPDAKNAVALFIAPFVLDPNDPNRILAGGLSLWRTNDAKTANTPTFGPSWHAIKPSTGFKISAIAVAKGQPATVWVGHTDGSVFRSSDATAPTPTWQRVDAVGPSPLSPLRYCTRIAIDAVDPKVVYVTFGGFVADNVWKTTDAGATWMPVGRSLPAAPVRAITMHPRHRDRVYVGAEVGVFASDDSGASWSPTNEGPTNCSVDDLFWMGDTLVAATHGRGMFTIDLSGV